MIFYLIAGVVSAAALIFLLLKFDIKKILCFDIFIDILGTALFVVLFSGTFAGMMAAVIAGCILSLFLYGLKRLGGYKKPVRKGVWFTWKEVSPHRPGTAASQH